MAGKIEYYILHPHIDGYWPQHCLDNIAQYLSWYFDAPVYHEEQKDKGTPIVLGAHYWKYVPKDAVIFNTEQLNAAGSMVDRWYYTALNCHQTFDYDSRHLDHFVNSRERTYYKDLDLGLVPIGHCPAWQTDFDKWKNVKKDVDVLCYGSTNPRRSYVMQYLQRRGIKVRSMTNLFGEALVEQICRAHCVLHTHFYPDGYHAPFRTVYAAHGTAVISEEDAAVPKDMPQFSYGDLDALVDMIKSGVPRYVPQVVERPHV